MLHRVLQHRSILSLQSHLTTRNLLIHKSQWKKTLPADNSGGLHHALEPSLHPLATRGTQRHVDSYVLVPGSKCLKWDGLDLSLSNKKQAGRHTLWKNRLFADFFLFPSSSKTPSKLLHRFDDFLLAYKKLPLRHLIYRSHSSKISLWNGNSGYLMLGSRPAL